MGFSAIKTINLQPNFTNHASLIPCNKHIRTEHVIEMIQWSSQFPIKCVNCIMYTYSYHNYLWSKIFIHLTHIFHELGWRTERRAPERQKWQQPQFVSNNGNDIFFKTELLSKISLYIILCTLILYINVHINIYNVYDLLQISDLNTTHIMTF